MAQKPFAHRGTTKKLRIVFDYLSFYTRALHGKFRLTYFDAFAGSGEIPHGDELPLLSGSEDYLNVVDGSARRALTIDPPFDRYVFVDQNKRNTAELTKLKSEFPKLADKIEIVTDDANRAVQEFCNSDLTPRDRAIVFLDPFGNQVKWSTIETIAKTSGVDLWYLFPSGLGVVRQLSADGEIQKDAEQSINEFVWDQRLVLGTDDSNSCGRSF